MGEFPPACGILVRDALHRRRAALDGARCNRHRDDRGLVHTALQPTQQHNMDGREEQAETRGLRGEEESG